MASNVTTQQWELVKELFEAALERGDDDYAAFLAEACPEDRVVRAEVQSLLAANASDVNFMTKPAGSLLIDTHPALLSGQHLGNYEIISTLGKGGMGQVYLALDTRLGRKVALKLLPFSKTRDPNHVQRLEQEARTASALNHPNIVTIHEIGEADSIHFMATEFVDGETLRQRMLNTELSVRELVGIAVQIASALRAAHEAGIVHRDIKPENVMLRSDGVVKVLDFGLAKLTGGGNSDGESGLIMGTTAYMSPEQARGEPIDARTDVWSLGVVIYEMIARRVPFTGETHRQVFKGIIENEPPTLDSNVAVPVELKHIVAKALSKDRNKRYDDASTMANELKSLQEELEIHARLGPRNVKDYLQVMQRHRVFTAIAVVLLVGAAGWAYVNANRNRINSSAGNNGSTAASPLKPPNSVARDAGGTTNREARRLYLHGMYLANKRNLADTQNAIDVLQQAVKLDPNYAQAWAGLGYAHRLISLYSNIPTHETYKRSIDAINKALAIDDDVSEAHSALCENKYLYEWDFAGAERECKRAIELDPTSAQAHEIFSRYLMGRGRLDEAIAEIERAIDLEPESRFNNKNYGRALFCARRYKEAEEQFKRVLAMDESFVSTYSWLTSTLALQGKEAEAYEWFKKLLSYRQVDQKTVRVFDSAFQTSGWRGVWREWLKRIDTVGGTTFDWAMYNAQLGNKDEAFKYLEKVYEQHEVWMTYLRVEPRLDPIRDDPRFQDLLKRVESR
ncbi:MAG TPA: serine/threonine-protein kinase [Pyrinomonadaceae bacterium]|nr:serine/threonine-protein kinase [Pyrinomonadaceae bacterium]